MSKPSYEELEALVKQHAAKISELGNLQPTQEMISAAQKEFADYYRNEREVLDEDLIVFLWQAMREAQNRPVTKKDINPRLTKNIPSGN